MPFLIPNWLQGSLVQPRGLLGALGAIMRSSWGRLGPSWGALAALWGSLEASWDGLGSSWVGLGVVLDPLGRSREAPGGLLGRFQIDQKIDSETDSKSSRIQDSQSGSNIMPANVSELERAHGTLNPGGQKNYQNR